MNRYGFFRIASAIPSVRPADVSYNCQEIMRLAKEADKESAGMVVFPELSVTGYTCADLFNQDILLEKAFDALLELATFSLEIKTAMVVGAPIRFGGCLYNCAAFIHGGRIKGIVPKTHIPNYNEFYEKRWFVAGRKSDSILKIDYDVPFSTEQVFYINGVGIGIEICEDLWVPVPPSCEMARHGADVIANLSATDELAGKNQYLKSLIQQQSARCRCAYVYSSAGAMESSTDVAFAGNAIIAEDGVILASSKRFCRTPQIVFADVDIEALRNDRRKYSTFYDGTEAPHCGNPDLHGCCDSENTGESDFNLVKYRKIDPMPFVNDNPAFLNERCEEISSIQAWGLAQRLEAIGCKNAVVGISGGLDSTLALLVTVKAFDMLGIPREGITGITMPGFGTTGRTRGNAWTLMEKLGVTPIEISINNAVNVHFSDIGHDPAKRDATYENSQARERTQILMDIANQVGGIVIGTGDLSELALGWCTYNGDQMSMYGVNASVPKTLVRHLVHWYLLSESDPETKSVLQDIIDTPISPELLPADKEGNIAQKTEDLVGPYELHDFFLYNMLRHGFSPAKIFFLASIAFKGIHSPAEIKKWLGTFYRRFFSQQFKRSCMPDGVKVGSICLSPRGDWRMPSDASVRLWLNQIDEIKL